MMETGRITAEDENPPVARVLAVAMVVCTFLGLVVATGLMLRGNLDSSPSRPAAYTSSSGPDSAVPPLYQVGGDCSAGGISAQWDMQNGQLNCVARDQIRGTHRAGEDCSHDGVAASWQFPLDRWVCVPQAGAPAPAGTPGPAPGPASAPAPGPGPAPAPAPVEEPAAPPSPDYVPPQQYTPPVDVYVPPAPQTYDEAPAPAPSPVPAPAPAPAPAPPVPWLPQLPPLPWLPQPPAP